MTAASEPEPWVAPTPAEVDGPLSGADRPVLEGFLSWQRRTLLNVCAGLTADQLASRPLPTSNLSLLGLVRHLAKVERIWFSTRVAELPVEPMYDPALGRDADFDDLDPARAGDDFARLQAEWASSDAAVANIDFDHTFVVHGDTFSLRTVYVHLIYEYGRHNGHADLLREAIDGATGR